MREMKAVLGDYPVRQEAEVQARWKMQFLAKQIGLDITGLSDEETAVLMKALRKSDIFKKNRRQGGRRR